MADSLYYVYGIVPPNTAVESAPLGLDGGRAELVIDGEVAALVGRVEASIYGSGVDERLADVAWLAPRASAHDAVLTWASDAGPVVPLPLLSLFRSEQAVRSMIDERRGDLDALLQHVARGREYGVRIFRVDGELRESLPQFSPAIAALEAEVSAATAPGQRFLLSRKLDAARKDELSRVATTVATGAFHDLAARSLATAQDPLPRATAEQDGTAVLNAAFLVAHERIDDFREAVTAFMREHARRGFRMEFTGPWPPYHFTRGTSTGVE